MSGTRVHSVERAALDLDQQLGQGGQGTVHHVTNRRINEAGDSWSVVYKEYNATVLPHVDAAALRTMVALLEELDAQQGRWLCEKTAWPAALVEEQGQTRGFLMRAIPARFRITVPGLTAKSAGTQRMANFEFLLNEDAYVAGIGLKVSDRDRILLLVDVAETLTRLHRMGIAVGDLSPKNLLFTFDPEPECFFIDCDAMRLRGASVLPQAETPEWQALDGEEKGTRATDVLQGAASPSGSSPGTSLDRPCRPHTALSPKLGELARASQDPEPLKRPTPVQWADGLRAAVPAASTVPAAAGSTTAAAKGRPQVKASAPTATKSGSAANTPSSAKKSNISKKDAENAGNWGKGLAGLSLLFMLISWHAPWFGDPTGGTAQVSLQVANQLSLLLFVKGFSRHRGRRTLGSGGRGLLRQRGRRSARLGIAVGWKHRNGV